MKHLFFYILFICSLTVLSQTEKKQVKYDNDFIQQKEFNQQKIDEYKADKEFIYVVEKRDPTWIEDFWGWLKRSIKNLLSFFFDDIKPAVGFLWWVLRVLPYVIAGVVLFLIIKFFLNVKARNILNGKKAVPLVKISEEEDLMHNEDLYKLLEETIKDKNYRLAVRYYYLLMLKKLSDKELIHWQQEKTNEDYKNELKSNAVLNSDFTKVTNLYDYVWYGEFDIDEELFNSAQHTFKSLSRNIG